MSVRYRDRWHAGEVLAELVAAARPVGPVVYGLARGGVIVAAPVAIALDAPLEVCVVRKLGVPYHPELAMGALGEEGVVVLNSDLVRRLGISPAEIARVRAVEERTLAERVARYRPGPPLPVEGRTVIVVDDGLATGATARAGIGVARRRGAAQVWLAVPVGAPDSVAELAGVADRVIAAAQPPGFRAVGEFYVDFHPTTDAEVLEALAAVEAARGTGRRGAGP